MAARIVLTTFGSLGDLHPFLALGLGLKARGHAVALATHEYYRSKIETAGLDFFPVRPNASPVRGHQNENGELPPRQILRVVQILIGPF